MAGLAGFGVQQDARSRATLNDPSDAILVIDNHGEVTDFTDRFITMGSVPTAVDGMEVTRIAAQEKLPVAVIMHSALGQDLLRRPLQTARSCRGNVLGAVSKPRSAGKLAPLLAQHRLGRNVGAPRPAALQ